MSTLRRIFGSLTVLFLAASASAQLQAVATTGMIGDVARLVGGDRVEVHTMMGPGIDPHLYRATPSDIQALQRAELVLYNGLHLEGQLGEVFARLSGMKPVVAVAEQAVPEEMLIDAGGAPDPHVWMDAGLFSRVAPVIADAYISLDPDGEAGYRERAEAVCETLNALDGWIRAGIATIPEEQRVLVTAHDAFTYFGAAYGMEVAGIQGVSTSVEAAVADIRETVALTVSRNIPAIFVESTISPRTVQAVIDAAASEGHSLTSGGELYSDAMGDPDGVTGSLTGMLWHNATVVITALGGTVQPLPPELHDWAASWGLDH